MTLIKIKCDYCGKDIFKTERQIRNSKGHYCSRSCSNKARGNKIRTTCNYCGKIFDIPKWRYDKYKSVFCSSDCQKKFFRENHINQKLFSIPCRFCGKLFKPTTKSNLYCSHKCWSNSYKKKPKIILKEEFAVLEVKYINKIFNVLIDLEDVEKCQKYSWQLLGDREKFMYFRNSKKQLLHRYIMNCPDNMVVDHINHDTLDNRKCNLRICTFKENTNNRSLINKSSKTGHTYINVKEDKFVVRIKGKQLGTFKNISEALNIRNEYLRSKGYDVDTM